MNIVKSQVKIMRNLIALVLETLYTQETTGSHNSINPQGVNSLEEKEQWDGRHDKIVVLKVNHINTTTYNNNSLLITA